MEILDPFRGDGYSLAHLTAAINVLPNQYGRINQMGLMPGEGITQRTVIVELYKGVLNLLPTRTPGSPGTTGKLGKAEIRNFTVPHIPHDDVVLPEEVQGIRAFGTQNTAETQAAVLARKIQTMRNKHAITLEHLRMGALKGIILDADGSTLFNLYSEFGITQKSVDFVLGTGTTNVQSKCREVLRHVEDNLMGEVTTGVRAVVSGEFFDKLISHAKVEDAYKFYLAGQQPLREDVRRNFAFGGITWEEYRGQASYLKPDGTTETRRFIAALEGHAFPEGTAETFKTYFAPADFNETANTLGLEVYAKLDERKFGRGWDLHTQSNPLPLCRRPEVLVKVFSSN